MMIIRRHADAIQVATGSELQLEVASASELEALTA
jgi:transketolase